MDLRRARQLVLDAHTAAECAHDLDALIQTFEHPRYEIVPTGEVFDGEDAGAALASRVTPSPSRGRSRR